MRVQTGTAHGVTVTRSAVFCSMHAMVFKGDMVRLLVIAIPRHLPPHAITHHSSHPALYTCIAQVRFDAAPPPLTSKGFSSEEIQKVQAHMPGSHYVVESEVRHWRQGEGGAVE